MPTKVIHIRNAPPGWKNNPEYQYIGRPSKWGNQYSHLGYSAAQFRTQTVEEAVAMFARHQLPKFLQDPDFPKLKGKTLVCFCKGRHACHGDPMAAALDQLP